MGERFYTPFRAGYRRYADVLNVVTRCIRQ